MSQILFYDDVNLRRITFCGVNYNNGDICLTNPEALCEYYCLVPCTYIMYCYTPVSRTERVHGADSLDFESTSNFIGKTEGLKGLEHFQKKPVSEAFPSFGYTSHTPASGTRLIWKI